MGPSLLQPSNPGTSLGSPQPPPFFSPFLPPSIPPRPAPQADPSSAPSALGPKEPFAGLNGDQRPAPAQKPPRALLSCLHPRTCHRRGVTTTCTSTHGGGCREGTAFGPPPTKGSKPHGFGPRHKYLAAVAANILFIYLFTYLAAN